MKHTSSEGQRNDLADKKLNTGYPMAGGSSPSLREGAQSESGTDRRNGHGNRGRGLGWLGLGLGLTQLAAPRMMARAIGVGGGSGACTVIRAVGAREVVSGLGVLRRRRPRGWLWARVVGNALDLALLGLALGSARGGGRWIGKGRKTRMMGRRRLPFALALVAGVSLLDLLATRRPRPLALAAEPAEGPMTD